MKFVFLHLPKTAGVALRQAILRNNPGLRMLPARDMVEISAFSTRELNAYDFFAGHFDWSYLDCLEGERFVFTLLRPPYDRVVSQYAYLKSLATSRGPELSPELHPNEYLIHSRSALEYFEIADIQWRDMVLDNFDNLYSHFYFHRGYRGQRMARRSRTSRERVLEVAIANMARLDYVATFANLERDLRRLEHLTGLAFANDLRRENVGPEGSRGKRETTMGIDPSGRLQALFEEFSELDRRLYEQASVGSFGIEGASRWPGRL